SGAHIAVANVVDIFEVGITSTDARIARQTRGKFTVHELAVHPAELTRRRRDMAPRLGIVSFADLFDVEDLDFFTLVEPHLMHVVHVAESGADKTWRAILDDDCDPVADRLECFGLNPAETSFRGANGIPSAGIVTVNL